MFVYEMCLYVQYKLNQRAMELPSLLSIVADISLCKASISVFDEVQSRFYYIASIVLEHCVRFAIHSVCISEVYTPPPHTHTKSRAEIGGLVSVEEHGV
jgi:hypothetical protein